MGGGGDTLTWGPLFSVPLFFQPSGVMESSDEETLSERSCISERSERSLRSERSGGSLSPCPSGPQGPPGDTLPWNRPSRHERGERRKRKTHDSVLDPAERAVVRVAGKTFGKYILLQHSPAEGIPAGYTCSDGN
ncbi:hypothetical protein J4Q44_G00030150 [Coregonus suidteri]|uniref:Uncharacterized protein n=1 Tax=Coregonus suidteri TaxID=861788 RepID=A0AAN8MMZ5_9TELE